MAFDQGQSGTITSVEALVLAVMTAILIAIAVPSYGTMQNRRSDASARAELREAADALAVRVEARGSASATRCLERTVRGRTWHLVLPERSVHRGACP